MKFEAVRIHFLQCKWRFSLLSSKNFATMAMWRNDLSSLLKARQRSKVTNIKHPQINASPCQKKQLLLKDCEKNIKYYSSPFPINSVSAKKEDNGT